MQEDADLSIGEKLKRARGRQGLEIRTLEERTKIRVKYLRALENEDWDVLPSPAYAKGFLRTYAQAVGLDADALVDEYRRTVEAALPGGQSRVLGEPVLETRRRLGGDSSTWGARAALLGGIAVVVLAIFLVLGLTGNDEPKGPAKHKHAAKHSRHGGHKGNSGSSGGDTSGPVNLTLTPSDTVVVCLVPGHGAPKIDEQPIPAGQRQPAQGSYVADHFRLDMYSGGTIQVGLNGHGDRIKAKRKASYDISAAGLKPMDFAGPNCP